MATRRFGARPTEDIDNLEGAVAPTDTDDETAGYAVGSVWIDAVLGLVYVCVDATEDNAVWFLTGSAIVPSAEEYTVTNNTPDRAIDLTSTTLDEVAQVLGTLIVDLIAAGLIQST